MASPTWQRLRTELGLPLALLGITAELLIAIGLIAALTDPGKTDAARTGLAVVSGALLALGIIAAFRLRRQTQARRSMQLLGLTLGSYIAGYLTWLAAAHLT